MKILNNINSQLVLKANRVSIDELGHFVGGGAVTDEGIIPYYEMGITSSGSSVYGEISPVTELKGSEITNIISRLNICNKSLENEISLIKKAINEINQMWIADEASKYVIKLSKANDKVSLVNNSIELLSKTYKSALDNFNSTTSQIKADIEKI